MTNVCVVTVTYGNRWEILKEMILSLTKLNVMIVRLIVVDNASSNGKTIQSLIYSKLDVPFDVKVIEHSTNLGSAGGFKAGIIESLKYSSDFIWLLDDDNCPEFNALKKNIDLYNLVFNLNPKSLISSHRLGRIEYDNAIQNNEEVSIKRNSFLGFTLSQYCKQRLRKLRKRNSWKTVKSHSIVNIKYAPYGGLLLPTLLFREANVFPNELFYLYFDDHDFTMRLIEKGWEIYLNPCSVINDLDRSWSNEEVKYPILNEKTPDFKVYYSIRNRIYLERHNNNNYMYILNGFCFLVILLIKFFSVSFKKNFKFSRITLIFKAIKDSEIFMKSH